MRGLKRGLRRRRGRGQAIIEYVVMLATAALAAVALISSVGRAVKSDFGCVNNALAQQTACAATNPGPGCGICQLATADQALATETGKAFENIGDGAAGHGYAINVVNSTVNLNTSLAGRAYFDTGGLTVTPPAGPFTWGNGVAIGVAGASSSVTINAPATVSPAPTYNNGTVADPLASLPVPVVPGPLNADISAGAGQTFNITPGIYGSVWIHGGTVNLASGTYVFEGNVEIDNNSSTMTGSGVTLYLSCNTYPASCAGGPANAGSINMPSADATSIVNLTAPASGTYQGVLLFADRTLSTPQDTAGGISQFYFNAASTWRGAIYQPTGQCDVHSPAGVTVTVNVRFVCGWFETGGAVPVPTATLNIDPTGTAGHP